MKKLILGNCGMLLFKFSRAGPNILAERFLWKKPALPCQQHVPLPNTLSGGPILDTAMAATMAPTCPWFE